MIKNKPHAHRPIAGQLRGRLLTHVAETLDVRFYDSYIGKVRVPLDKSLRYSLEYRLTDELRRYFVYENS